MTNQEPRYKRQVFDGLLNTLDVVLMDNTIIHIPDNDVRRNYDIRDDGVWLLKNDTVPAFNWTPASDLEEGPESPDPLTTPALPFPFTARQLAAFTLYGWGWFLGRRFADDSGLLDKEIVSLLLGGSLDTKLRESITAAFSALQNARLNTPIPDPELERALVKTQEECETAETEAAAEHDWRDANQPEAMREKRRLAYLAAVNPYRKKKREAQVAYDEAQKTWRKAMVRQLLNLTPPKQDTSNFEHQEEHQAFVAGFYEATYDLVHWTALGDVSPQEAAALLCGINPLDDKHHSVGKDFTMLERRFSDHAKSHPERRRLTNWWELACTWKVAGHLNGITLNSDLGEALTALNAQYQPTAAQPPQTAPEPQQASEAALVVAKGPSNTPADSITTAQVAAVFYDIHYSAENWIKQLSAAKWLQPANRVRGAPGGDSSLWCPLELAKLIHGKGRGPHDQQKRLQALNKRFKNSPVLGAWRDDWNKHYEMFNDAD